MRYISLIAYLTLSTACLAEVQTDGSLGAKQSFSGKFNIPASLGKQQGGNLFHSFDTFNLLKGESATFTGPGNVRNVIARVTGGAASHIDGALASSIPNADVYFINPAGVVFGAEATLNVQGSFFVSTADFVRFSDGSHLMMHASEPAPILSAAPPSAFGFLGKNVGNVTFAGANRLSKADVNGVRRFSDSTVLEVSAGRSFVIAAGQVNVAGTTLRAPSGRLSVTARATRGEVAINGPLNPAATGTITLTDATQLDVSGKPGGAIVVAAESLSMTDSELLSQSRGTRVGGAIDVAVGRHVNLNRSSIDTRAAGAGSGGAISVVTHLLDMAGVPLLSKGFDLHRPDSDPAAGGIYTTTATDVSGTGGAVSVRAHSIRITGGWINSATEGIGPGGEVSVHAGTLLLAPFLNDVSAGIAAGARRANPNKAGNVDVSVRGLLKILAGAGIHIQNAAHGQGSDLTIRAGRVVIDGGSASPFATGISSTGGFGGGGGGNILISSSTSIDVRNAMIDTTALGNGGNITLRAPLFIRLIDSSIEATSARNGGNLTIDPLVLSLVASSVSANGNSSGGNITISADAVPGAVFTGEGANVTATGQSGVNGVIGVGPAQVDVTRALARLPAELLSSLATLQPQCGQGSAFSSFLFTGTGGMKFTPGLWFTVPAPDNGQRKVSP